MMIEVKNAFYHSKSGYYIDGAFHMIDTFMIGGEGPGRKSMERLEKPLTFFVCNKIVHESFIAGNIRSIDLHFALSLERPLWLRLFRYLDKKRHGERPSFEVGLREPCSVHLGMVVAERYDSTLRASLEGAHAELCARGFLAGVSFEKMKTRKGTKVVYLFASHLAVPPPALEASEDLLCAPLGTPPEAPIALGPTINGEQMQLFVPAAILPGVASLLPMPKTRAREEASAGSSIQPSMQTTSHIAPSGGLGVPGSGKGRERRVAHTWPEVSESGAKDGLAMRMIALGVSEPVARELCASYPSEAIEMQLDCLAVRQPKSPAAALVKSIRQGWSAPAAYMLRQEAQEALKARPSQESEEKALRLQERREQAANKARERATLAAQETEAAHLDALWQQMQMESAERERIEAQARHRLGVLGAAGRAPAALSAMRRAMRRTLLRERIG